VPNSLEAGVISLKSRTSPVEHAISESLSALSWLRAQGCRQIIFKYCSTFDSTADGNIGPVAEALAKALNVKGVVVCPAFPNAGRTVYQGHLFVFDRLLNECGMQNHPLTPMRDPDIRRCLSHQTNEQVDLVPHETVRSGVSSVESALASAKARGVMFCVVDATSNRDLVTIGEAVADSAFVTGGSGIAMGLPRNFIGRGDATGGDIEFDHSTGSAAILVGSCAGATRGQVDFHKQSHPTYHIDVSKVMTGSLTAQALCEFICEHEGHYPLVYSSGTPSGVKDIQDRFGRDNVAHKLDSLFADTARTLVRQGYSRLVVAGGETSGAVAQAVTDELSSPAMRIGAEIDPGVPVLSLERHGGNSVNYQTQISCLAQQEQAKLVVPAGDELKNSLPPQVLRKNRIHVTQPSIGSHNAAHPEQASDEFCQ